MKSAGPVRDDARDDTAVPSSIVCPTCGSEAERAGRQRFCSPACRQKAYRDRQHTPPAPVRRRPNGVYECGECGERQLGEQRCDQCGVFGRRVGTGAACPHCGARSPSRS